MTPAPRLETRLDGLEHALLAAELPRTQHVPGSQGSDSLAQTSGELVDGIDLRQLGAAIRGGLKPGTAAAALSMAAILLFPARRLSTAARATYRATRKESPAPSVAATST